MDERGVKLFLGVLMEQVETLYLRYKPHRQPPIERVCSHLNLLCIEMGLTLRVYWNPEMGGYDFDYQYPDVVDEIPLFKLLFKKFSLEYDSLLEPLV
jgi:hypothetical protein